MFTKTHFEAIAHVLDANEADLNLVLDFADMFEDDNSRFNRGLFVQAATGNLTKQLSFDARRLEREKLL